MATFLVFALIANADFGKDVVYATAIIQTTVLGDPGHNGSTSTTLSLGGTGKSGFSVTAKAIAGPI